MFVPLAVNPLMSLRVCVMTSGLGVHWQDSAEILTLPVDTEFSVVEELTVVLVAELSPFQSL